jgi:hypothetical protein
VSACETKFLQLPIAKASSVKYSPFKPVEVAKF